MDCMNMMGGMGGGVMMVGMGVQWLLFVAVAILAIAALLKYLRAPRT